MTRAPAGLNAVQSHFWSLQQARRPVAAMVAAPVAVAVAAPALRTQRRITRSNHEAHNLDYFLRGVFKAEDMGEDVYLQMFHFLQSGGGSLLEIVMDDAPQLLTGRVQVVRTRIYVDRSAVGVRAWTSGPLPPAVGPQVIHVSLMQRLLGGDNSHANVIYIDPAQRQIEYFEPHGVATWTYDAIEAIKASGVLPAYEYVVPAATCPIIRGVRENTGPQSQLRLSLCAQFSQQYALYRVLNPGVPAAELNRWLSRGGASAQLERLERTWAYVLEFLLRTNPAKYAEVMGDRRANADLLGNMRRIKRMHAAGRNRHRREARSEQSNAYDAYDAYAGVGHSWALV